MPVPALNIAWFCADQNRLQRQPHGSESKEVERMSAVIHDQKDLDHDVKMGTQPPDADQLLEWSSTKSFEVTNHFTGTQLYFHITPQEYLNTSTQGIVHLFFGVSRPNRDLQYSLTRKYK